MGDWLRRGTALIEQIAGLELAPGEAALWNLTQESYVLKVGETITYIDPFLTDPLRSDGSPMRALAAPFAPAAVDHADLVFCTHHHLDHLDLGTLVPLAASSPQARFIVPRPHLARCVAGGLPRERLVGARAAQTMALDPLTVTPVAAAHDSFETDETGDHRYLGYILATPDLTIYHAGDTVDYPELVEALKPHAVDVAMLPINGLDRKRTQRNIIGNLNFREAVDLAVDMGARLVIPMHYDLFPGNQVNPAYFVDYLYHAYRTLPFRMLAPGECLLVSAKSLA